MWLRCRRYLQTKKGRLVLCQVTAGLIGNLVVVNAKTTSIHRRLVLWLQLCQLGIVLAKVSCCICLHHSGGTFSRRWFQPRSITTAPAFVALVGWDTWCATAKQITRRDATNSRHKLPT